MALIGSRRALLGASSPVVLSLNFLTMTSLPSNIAFSRSTTATYTNASGALATAAVNAPRFDYSPTSIGTPTGFLLEGQATNLALQSQNINQSYPWIIHTGDATTTSVVGATSPDGTADATTLNNPAGAQTSVNWGVYQAVTVTNATAYTFSLWVKAGTSSAARLTLTDGTDGIISTLVITPTSTWTRYSVTGTSTSTTVRLQISTNATAGTVLIFGCQIETGNVATSYIPTTTTAVTRATDVAPLTVPALGSQGTVVTTASVEGNALSNQMLASINGIYSNFINANFKPATNDGTNTVAATSTISVGATSKVANSWGPAGLALSANQATPVTNASYSGNFNSQTTIGLGSNGFGTAPLQGHLQTLTLYAKQYTGAQLQAL